MTSRSPDTSGVSPADPKKKPARASHLPDRPTAIFVEPRTFQT